MRLSYLEMAGFRGIRNRTRINFAPGFVVITGRNGSGKSTICDAVEYALTGTISKYSGGSERGESVEDYIWWRGDRAAEDRFVTLGIEGESGETTVLTRRPSESLSASNVDAVVNLLCAREAGSGSVLDELCRTTVIRDETLAALSVDLAEVDRFAFVRTALGTDALERVAHEGKTVTDALRKRAEDAKAEYTHARSQVAALHSQLSEARALATQAVDIGDALDRVRVLLAAPAMPAEKLAIIARREIAEERRRVDALLRVLRDAEAYKAASLEVDEAGLAAEDARVVNALRKEQHSLGEIDAEISTLSRTLESAGSDDALRTTLATLYETGVALGVKDGQCPLCLSPITEAKFSAALQTLRAQLEDAAQVTASRQQRLSVLQSQRQAAVRRIGELEAVRLDQVRRQRQQKASKETWVNEAKKLGLREDTLETPEAFGAHIAEAQRRLEQLERAIGILDASAALDRAAELSSRLETSQIKSDSAEKKLAEIEEAQARAKRLINGIRRAVGELVEERLASLEPLLKDLYSRLRPHVDWLDISYHLRGDVRRALSLRVGEDINPRYTFSSGQRRAIGLAFLLAVHLSRPWCKLRSLVLDDPIQHIDDYRALNLVEVLAAIRQSGQQVICAVEDPALAQVLCRRLRSEEGEGIFVEMTYSAGEGIIAKRAVVPRPLANLVLSA